MNGKDGFLKRGAGRGRALCQTRRGWGVLGGGVGVGVSGEIEGHGKYSDLFSLFDVGIKRNTLFRPFRDA